MTTTLTRSEVVPHPVAPQHLNETGVCVLGEEREKARVAVETDAGSREDLSSTLPEVTGQQFEVDPFMRDILDLGHPFAHPA